MSHIPRFTIQTASRTADFMSLLPYHLHKVIHHLNRARKRMLSRHFGAFVGPRSKLDELEMLNRKKMSTLTKNQSNSVLRSSDTA